MTNIEIINDIIRSLKIIDKPLDKLTELFDICFNPDGEICSSTVFHFQNIMSKCYKLKDRLEKEVKNHEK